MDVRDKSRRLAVFLSIFSCVLFARTASEGEGFVGPEHRLYTDLFAGYLPDSRPVTNASHTVMVTFALSLNQLLDLDEKNQVLTTSVWIYEEWIDETLTWIPANYQDQSSIMIPATSIWLPDVFIFNTAGDGMNGFVNVNGSKVAIRYDGRVRWMVPLMVSSACAVDVTYFPYDRQECSINFGSWIYDNRQMDIRVETNVPDLQHYIMNSEYDLENVSISLEVLNSTCCPGEGSHSIVSLNLALKRKSLYYDYIVIAPTIMLCVLTLASFLLPCDRGEKMAIGLTVFLTLYVLQLRIADNVPDTNTTPILGVFMLIVMTFNCVSLIMAAVVMNIKKRGDDVTCPEVPNWLFILCNQVLGRVVCTSFQWREDFESKEFMSYSKTVRQRSDHLYVAASNRMSRADRDCLRYTPLRCIGDSPSRSCEYDSSDDDRYGTPTRGRVTCPRSSHEHDYSFVGDVQEEVWVRAKNRNEEDVTEEIMSGSKNSSRSRRLNGKGEAIPLQLQHGLVEDCACESHENRTGEDVSGRDMDGVRQRRHGEERRAHIASLSGQLEEETDMLLGGSPLDEDSSAASHDEIKIESKIYAHKRRWFFVAQVVDKFSFLVYLILLTVSIFTVLFLIPVYFRNDK
ncbi:neuronal acetylcholine receptor subunit alpha-9-like precursor [Aplysia californica]|uniref:Neuronal acetylcholine receptor subunit alpha-9-like precursor n=1 Tax=Aplysia californica TaxID=6500 RepID=M4VNE8_APLCA|nr:neuronal acetylcholine receptor subunit alpha-9-like precursor [Aplysia californica]AGI03855.1 nicotinic acetylcholine receptor subunit type O [Aplysia californica]